MQSSPSKPRTSCKSKALFLELSKWKGKPFKQTKKAHYRAPYTTDLILYVMKPLTEYWWVTCVILVLLWLVFAYGESTCVLWESRRGKAVQFTWIWHVVSFVGKIPTGVQNLDVNMVRFRGDAAVSVLAWRLLLLPGCSDLIWMMSCLFLSRKVVPIKKLYDCSW